MATLTGTEILHQISMGNIKIDPFTYSKVNTNSVDLRLGDKLYRYAQMTPESAGIAVKDFLSNRIPGQVWRPDKPGRIAVVDPDIKGTYFALDIHQPPPLVEVPQIEGGGWLLVPGRLYIGSTYEHTETQGFVPSIVGRSSTGRVGVFAHVTAGRGDNGFRGTWTMEMTSVEPVVVYPRSWLFQIYYDTQEGAPTLYGDTGNTSGRYQDQQEPTPLLPDSRPNGG